MRARHKAGSVGRVRPDPRGTDERVRHECWIVETSKDGERWRFFGKAWKEPDEALLLHAVPRYVRVRPDGDPEWREALEASDDTPITLLKVEQGIREELWPEDAHIGLPMLLPGGEIGRLLRFEPDDELGRWTYALELRGSKGMSGPAESPRPLPDVRSIGPAR